MYSRKILYYFFNLSMDIILTVISFSHLASSVFFYDTNSQLSQSLIKMKQTTSSVFYLFIKFGINQFITTTKNKT